MMRIYTNNEIEIDDKRTGVFLAQTLVGITLWHNPTMRELRMPKPRYSLACDKPSTGVAGRAEFESDLRKVLEDIGVTA